MNGLSVMNRTAPVSRYMRAVSSAIVLRSRKVLMRPFKARNGSGRQAAMPSQRTGKIEQRLVASRPADEGEADRAAVERARGQAQLGQAGDAGRAGEPHHARAELVHVSGRAVDQWRDA